MDFRGPKFFFVTILEWYVSLQQIAKDYNGLKGHPVTSSEGNGLVSSFKLGYAFVSSCMGSFISICSSGHLALWSEPCAAQHLVVAFNG